MSAARHLAIVDCQVYVTQVFKNIATCSLYLHRSNSILPARLRRGYITALPYANFAQRVTTPRRR